MIDTRTLLAAIVSAGIFLSGCERTASPPIGAAAPTSKIITACLGSAAIGRTVTVRGGRLNRGAVQRWPEERVGGAGEVTDFDIDATEVTHGQFAAFVKATGYVTVAERIGADGKPQGAAVFDRQQSAWRLEASANWRAPLGAGSTARDDEPVTAVAFEDAAAYAKWRDRRLPSELEWEWAARGDAAASEDPESERRDPQGRWLANTWQGSFPALDQGDDGYRGVAPVGCFPGNARGLYDMVGNVWEWTTDWYSDAVAPATAADAKRADPEKVGKRVIKGGSHLCSSDFCERYRSGSRQPADASLGTSHVGFRTVRSLSATATKDIPQRRPNIVVIVADDFGYTDIGAFGSEIRTPNIDALANEGTRFASFHVASECSPTRAMLLTGVNSHRTGVGAMHESVPPQLEGKPGYLTVLDRNVVTMSSRLQQHGYRTYAVGKWHVGKEDYNLPPARGFDRSIVQGDSGSDNWRTDQRYLALTDRVAWFEDGKPAQMPKEFYSSRYYVDRAIDYLRNDWSTRKTAAGEPPPFMLYLAFQANHIPLQAPAEALARQHGRYDAGWQVVRDRRRERAIELGLLPANTAQAQWSGIEDWNSLSPQRRRYDSRRMEVYAAMAETMDAEIGRLRETIRALGQDRDTVFVFLSDNGAEPSDPYEYLSGRMWLMTQYTRAVDRMGSAGAYATIGRNWVSAANAPLATHKFYAGEGALRVPLVIRGPGLLPEGDHGGRIVKSFTHVTDIAPTLLDLAGVAVGDSSPGIEPISGKSLVPVLRGAAASARGPQETVGFELAGNSALFAGDLKLVRNMPPVGSGDWQLFDIAVDPGETRDLRLTRSQDFERLSAAYQKFERDDKILPLPAGYEPRTQVSQNALRRVILPTMLWPAIGFAAMGLIGWWLARRRKKS